MSRHENSNQFKDGLLMDLHPLQTPNTVLTDNLNGTFITYNGNEYSLQNDMGNFKLRNCRLEPKYFPIGTTSYADTIYIVSYNPIDQKVQIGSYPAPVQYNDNLSGRKKKFYTITEAFVLDTFRLNPTTDEGILLTLDTSKISEFTTSIVFNGDEFRLKGGDEISINYDQLVTCGFEELVSNVIYDSGKKQKVNLKYNKGYDSVPWSTAGHVEMTSRIFDIDKCEVFVANEYYTKTNCHVDFQIDLFISDEGLIKKINDSHSIFNSKGETDSIWINAPEFSINDSTSIIPSVQYYKTTKWLGEFLKVSFIVSYDFGLIYENETPVIETYSLDFTPIFKTSITFSNQTGNDDIDLKKLSTIINFDTKQVKLEHIVDPSKNPFNKVGDKVFNWSNVNRKWKIKANGSKLDDSVGKMFYKVVPVLTPDGNINTEALIELEEWKDDITWNDNELVWEIEPESTDPYNFYYVFYKALEWKKHEELEVQNKTKSSSNTTSKISYVSLPDGRGIDINGTPFYIPNGKISYNGKTHLVYNNIVIENILIHCTVDNDKIIIENNRYDIINDEENPYIIIGDKKCEIKEENENIYIVFPEEYTVDFDQKTISKKYPRNNTTFEILRTYTIGSSAVTDSEGNPYQISMIKNTWTVEINGKTYTIENDYVVHTQNCDVLTHHKDGMYIVNYYDDNNFDLFPYVRPSGSDLILNSKGEYIDKAELYNTENRTYKVFFTGMPYNTVQDRYDMLSFEEFVKTAYDSDSLSDWNVTTEGNLLLDLSTKEDLVAGTSDFKLTKYFKRYEDKTINFPSFVKVGDIPSESTMLYAAQKFTMSPAQSTSSTSSTSSTEPEGIFSNWEKGIQCNNGFRTVDVQKNSDDKFEFKSYIGKKCSISVGKQFMFVDGLKYYQLKAKPLSPDNDSYSNQQFHIITLDKNGKSSNNYFIEAPVPNYNDTYKWWPDFKSVDLGNFRSIRMHYHPYHGNKNSGYNTHGCCQVDFGAGAAMGAKQMLHVGGAISGTAAVGSGIAAGVAAGTSGLLGAAIVGAASGIIGGGVIAGAMLGTAIIGSIIGATKTLEYASIPNLCNYIGNFHKNIRTQLDENWNINKPVLDGESKTLNDNDTKELQLNGNHAIDVALISKTFYRDTAQRPTFTNSSGVDICPTWDKWTKERNGPDSNDDNKGISAQGCFITFPLYEKLNQSIDREDWWKVSSSEQHTIPEISGYEEIDGVGLVAISKSPHNSILNLMAAWVPGNPDAKFERYGSPTIKFDNKQETVHFELFPTRILPDHVKDIITRMKNTYTELSELTILNMDKKAFVSGDTWNSTNNDVWDDVTWSTSEYDSQIEEDFEKLKLHKIFKYVSFQTNPDTRIQSYPVAGVYPVREDDQLSASNYSVFEGATGFTGWDKFKVDEEGRVFLTNLDSKDNIYVKKNSNKTIFGYFPYLPNCERWI